MNGAEEKDEEEQTSTILENEEAAGLTASRVR